MRTNWEELSDCLISLVCFAKKNQINECNQIKAKEGNISGGHQNSADTKELYGKINIKGLTLLCLFI